MYTHNPKWDGTPSDSAVVHCFEILESVLTECASCHSLLIRKYYHDQPMWSFHFRNPKGGFGMLQMHATKRKEGVIGVAIASHWWVDDRERGIRASLSTHVRSLQATRPEEIGSLLGDTLAQLLSRAPSELLDARRMVPDKRDEARPCEYNEFEKAQRLPT
jgi:hypothetical protein